jgi:hypothetical protein
VLVVQDRWRRHDAAHASGSREAPAAAGCPETRREARAIVEPAGLTYVEAPYIADAVRRLGIRK